MSTAPRRLTQFSDLPAEIRVDIWSYVMPRRLVEFPQASLQDKKYIWQYRDPAARKPGPPTQGSNMPRIPRSINQESRFLFHYQQSFAKIRSTYRSWPDHNHALLRGVIPELQDPIQVSPPLVAFDFLVDTLVMKPVALEYARFRRQDFDKLRYVAIYLAEFTGNDDKDGEWTKNDYGQAHDNLIRLIYEAFENIQMICLLISDEDENWAPEMKTKYTAFRKQTTAILTSAYIAALAREMCHGEKYSDCDTELKIQMYDEKWRSIVTVLTEGELRQARGVPHGQRLFEVSK